VHEAQIDAYEETSEKINLLD